MAPGVLAHDFFERAQVQARRDQQQAETASLRRNLVGSGDRSERIRTYNFPQGRLTDRRMSDRSIARLIQKYAGLVGLDPESVGGHSLRAGFLTEASRTGATIAKMQEVSRHKKVEVLLGYVRSAELFDAHAGGGFL